MSVVRLSAGGGSAGGNNNSANKALGRLALLLGLARLPTADY